MGNITRDIEVKFTSKGTAVCEVGLAINRNWTTDSGEKKEEVTYVGVTFWGRTAENVGKFFKKGQPMFVEGRLTQESWDDKETGKKVTKTKVVGEKFEFCGGGDRQQSSPASKTSSVPADPEDDDIPF